MVYEVRFADGWLRFSLPARAEGVVARPPEARAGEAWQAVREALREPLGTPPLAALARAGDRVCVAVGHPTEATPDRQLVPPLVTTLEFAGVAKEDITILIANGERRPSTPAEKEEQLGTEIVQRYKVIDHDARDGAWLANLGPVVDGIPLLLNRRAATADLLISTGAVGPDLLFGDYNGGSKTVALGCAGSTTIRGVVAAVNECTLEERGRFIYDYLTAASRRSRHAFALNCVVASDAAIVAVAAGEPGAVQECLKPVAERTFCTVADRLYDVAVLGLGWPYDLDLELALATVAWSLVTTRPVLRAGGVAIVAARLPDGLRGFARETHRDVAVAGGEVKTGPNGSDRPSAVTMLELLRRYNVVVVGVVDPAPLAHAGVAVAATIEEALTWAAELTSNTMRVVIVEQAAKTRLEHGG